MTHNKLKLNLKNDKQITVLNKTRTTSYQYIEQMKYSSWNFKDSNKLDHFMDPWNKHESSRKLKKNMRENFQGTLCILAKFKLVNR